MELILEVWNWGKEAYKPSERQDGALELLQILEDNSVIDSVDDFDKIQEAYGSDDDLDEALNQFLGIEEEDGDDDDDD